MINTNFYPEFNLGIPSYSRLSGASLSRLSAVDTVGPTQVNFVPIAPIDSVSLGGDLNSAADFMNQVASLKSMAVRSRAVSDVGAGQLPSNWDTMPLGEFLNEMARIREAAGPAKPKEEKDKAKDGGEKGTFAVNAHRYWDYSKGEYVNPKKVEMHEKNNWAKKEPTAWNAGSSNEMSAKKENAELGKTYQVTVTWEDGTTKTWDYKNEGQAIDIWSPNS